MNPSNTNNNAPTTSRGRHRVIVRNQSSAATSNQPVAPTRTRPTRANSSLPTSRGRSTAPRPTGSRPVRARSTTPSRIVVGGGGRKPSPTNSVRLPSGANPADAMTAEAVFQSLPCSRKHSTATRSSLPIPNGTNNAPTTKSAKEAYKELTQPWRKQRSVPQQENTATTEQRQDENKPARPRRLQFAQEDVRVSNSSNLGGCSPKRRPALPRRHSVSVWC